MKVQKYGQFTIEPGSPLGVACDKAFVSSSALDDYCPLCDAHPSSGHSRTCPLVVDAIAAGHELVAEGGTK